MLRRVKTRRRGASQSAVRVLSVNDWAWRKRQRYGTMLMDLGPAIEVSTGFSASISACEAHREFIESSLTKGRNAMAIWQDLVDQYGFSHAYASVRRFVAKLREGTRTEACAIIITAPGDEAQVELRQRPQQPAP